MYLWENCQLWGQEIDAPLNDSVYHVPIRVCSCLTLESVKLILAGWIHPRAGQLPAPLALETPTPHTHHGDACNDGERFPGSL